MYVLGMGSMYVLGIGYLRVEIASVMQDLGCRVLGRAADSSCDQIDRRPDGKATNRTDRGQQPK